MEGDDLEFTTQKRDAKKGRRARADKLESSANNQPNGDIGGDETPEGAIPMSERNGSPRGPPNRPKRRQGGWADDAPKVDKNVSESVSDLQKFSEERSRPESPKRRDDSDDDIPVIPDLDDVQEEDMAAQIAAPPSVQVNRVATYRELDNDLLKHSQLLTLDNDIDLKLLTKVLSAEQEVIEEDIPWDWDLLFTEVSSELQTEWDKQSADNEEKGKA
ncbi:intraflagellar transport protein 43 homolog isoform X1 [Asterias rubens]|uniref:intraflagellar transport protein 43 homolog isoform X1 n=1 Tax=Asterias rubens TaxID=7604 RepID=UPI0014556B80|nr:intraflagellar transport protein 43 homolog isoform X1 [Asterias rubens]XP_033640515.1 intraflagellar transport protein 43 homolog isoform X1 [Asterias rubens]XP_033640525.1 intraflagellar transport protein 43 homolog isoform X1 [Asterias rubens]